MLDWANVNSDIPLYLADISLKDSCCVSSATCSYTHKSIDCSGLWQMWDVFKRNCAIDILLAQLLSALWIADISFWISLVKSRGIFLRGARLKKHLLPGCIFSFLSIDLFDFCTWTKKVLGNERKSRFLANLAFFFEPSPHAKLQTSVEVKSSNWLQQALMEGPSTEVFYSWGIIYIFKSYFILSSCWHPTDFPVVNYYF